MSDIDAEIIDKLLNAEVTDEEVKQFEDDVHGDEASPSETASVSDGEIVIHPLTKHYQKFVPKHGQGLIYRAYCRKTKKSYIGQTIQRFQKRKNDHLFDARKKPKGAFHLALRKHGPDAFDWEILIVTNAKSLNHFEEMFISGFDSVVPNGYNILSKSDHVSSEKALTRKKEDDSCLPKYIISCESVSKKGVRSSGYFCKLPNGKSKRIVHRGMTMEKKLELLKEWMADAKKDCPRTNSRKRATTATGINDLPFGVYLESGKGYYVQVKGFPKKKFCRQTVNMTEKKALALAYLQHVMSPSSVPDYEKYHCGVKISR